MFELVKSSVCSGVSRLIVLNIQESPELVHSGRLYGNLVDTPGIGPGSALRLRFSLPRLSWSFFSVWRGRLQPRLYAASPATHSIARRQRSVVPQAPAQTDKPPGARLRQLRRLAQAAIAYSVLPSTSFAWFKGVQALPSRSLRCRQCIETCSCPKIQLNPNKFICEPYVFLRVSIYVFPD